LSYKTAIARSKLSLPAQLFKPFLEGGVLDFGCGRGTDATFLGATPYDPHYFPGKPAKGSFDTVMVIYVLNVVQNSQEVLDQAKEYVKPGGLLMVACRSISEINRLAEDKNWRSASGGWVTRSGTFQRGISNAEIQTLAGWDDVVKAGTKEFSYAIIRRNKDGNV